MGVIREKGIIVKQNDYGEGKRWLKIFTENYGIIDVLNHSVRQQSRTGTSSQFLCYGEYELYFSNRNNITLKDVEIEESFFPLTEDIVKISLCTYLADVTYALIGYNNPDKRLLKTFLNLIYALAYRNEPEEKIKAVYELRIMVLEGYMPNLDACACGKNEHITSFDFDKGCITCDECRGTNSYNLSSGVYKAMRFIAQTDDKHLLSFTGNEEMFRELGGITEKYLLTHIDKHLRSLDYYKKIKNI